ncbi:HupE/UreJ family protein [Maritalea sp. S77]|uniref:HupE/UreJ family protein n=1 Tax=Maritalea sp. S77 TaxID=3415125 RepID=UPI003C7A07A5
MHDFSPAYHTTAKPLIRVWISTGFALATAVLHAGGVVIGLAIDKVFSKHDKSTPLLSRAIGGITVLVGLGLFFA